MEKYVILPFSIAFKNLTNKYTKFHSLPIEFFDHINVVFSIETPSYMTFIIDNKAMNIEEWTILDPKSKIVKWCDYTIENEIEYIIKKLVYNWLKITVF